MYNEEIMNEFYNPENVGVIKGASAVGKVTSPICGEIVKIFVTVENNKIVNATFQTYGSAATIAATSKATKMIMNKTLDEARKINERDILLSIGGSLPETKQYIPALIVETIQSMIEDYEKNTKA